MLTITSRPYAEPRDRETVAALVVAYRVATGLAVHPTLWRLRLLLTSRVRAPEHDTRVWSDAAGRLLAFALLWRRAAGDGYLALEQAIDPERATAALYDALLSWAVARSRALATERRAPLTLYTGAINPALGLPVPLEAHGFAPLPPRPEQHNVYYARSLAGPLPSPVVPADHAPRPLRADEVERYQALYDFAP